MNYTHLIQLTLSIFLDFLKSSSQKKTILCNDLKTQNIFTKINLNSLKSFNLIKTLVSNLNILNS